MWGIGGAAMGVKMVFPAREDMAEALDFAARGKVKADVELPPLSAINEVFARLAHGDVAARVVLDFKEPLLLSG